MIIKTSQEWRMAENDNAITSCMFSLAVWYKDEAMYCCLVCTIMFTIYIPKTQNLASFFVWYKLNILNILREIPLKVFKFLQTKEHLSSPPVFCAVRVAQSLYFRVLYCISLLSFFCWPSCCLSVECRLLITPLVALNLSQHFKCYL